MALSTLQASYRNWHRCQLLVCTS